MSHSLHAVAVLACCAVIGTISPAQIKAQGVNPSADDIVNALAPGGTRGLGLRSLRGIEQTPGNENATASIDLYITFKVDSAELEPEALRTLRVLAQALQSPKLASARILIVGHTDATGATRHNQELSSRRANAVRSVLVGAFDINPAQLATEGKGATELKDPTKPDDGINRRVEIRNVTAY